MENEHMEPNMSDPVGTGPAPVEPKKPNGGGVGPVIGIIIIIVLLGLGGVYYFTTGVDQLHNNSAQSAENADQAAAALTEQSSSTDISSIEADVNATDLSGLDSASANFDSQLQTGQ